MGHTGHIEFSGDQVSSPAIAQLREAARTGQTMILTYNDQDVQVRLINVRKLRGQDVVRAEFEIISAPSEVAQELEGPVEQPDRQ